MAPFLSLVIPTRERHETLGYAIETALMDPMPELEVIVSDNFSSRETAEVVRSFSDSRLKYVRTDRRLSMCDNWEFALGHATGDYIIYIGDDDAVMPGALSRLKDLHSSHPAAVYKWPTHIYTWPRDGIPAEVSHLATAGERRPMDLHAAARLMMRMGGWKHYEIPCMYHSAVARSIPDAIRARTGRVFHTTQPDVFLSAAIPAFTNSAMHTGFTVTSHGRSPKSNGGSALARQGSSIQAQFVSEYPGYRIHPTLYPGVTVRANLIVDAILVARDLFPEFYRDMHFDYDAMWGYLLRLQRFFKWDLSTREVLAKRNDIRAYHAFHPGRVLAYAAMHEASNVRRAVLDGVGAAFRPSRATPDNIRDFVLTIQPASGHKGDMPCQS